MRKIQDIEDREQEDDIEYKYRPRNFRLKTIDTDEHVKRKHWDKEHTYGRPDDYED